MAAPKLTLTYFGFPGRAEVARLVLTIGRVNFQVRTRNTCICTHVRAMVGAQAAV
jgi:hypothetical protein